MRKPFTLISKATFSVVSSLCALSMLVACAPPAVPAQVDETAQSQAPTLAPLDDQPYVWVVPSLYRIGRSDYPGAAVNATIAAARGEVESFQIVVRAPSSGLTEVSLKLSPLVGPEGARIDGEHITLYRAHYVEVVHPSHDPQRGNRPLGPGWYADALIPLIDPETGQAPLGGQIPAVPVEVEAEQNQPFWVDVSVPRSAPPGEYRGRYTLSSDQGVYEGEVQLTVWDFELPLRPSLTTSFLMRERTAESREELLRHRLMPFTTPARDQRYAIERWGLSAHGVGLWSGAQQGECKVEPPPPVEEMQELAASADPELMLYAYSADEIDACTEIYEELKAWARSLHAAGINNLIPMTPVPELFDDGSGTGRSAVDIWVVLPKMYDAAPELIAQAQAKGDQVWSYNALVQDDYSPKWLIDFAPINYRIQPGFISQSLGLSGLLYWSVDRWTNDPWHDVNTYTNDDGWQFPGEGMLLYPGGQVGLEGVVPSMRLKWLRDGVEDYEYIALLEKSGRGEAALEIARTVGGSWSSWSDDPAAVEAARRRLAELLTANTNNRP